MTKADPTLVKLHKICLALPKRSLAKLDRQR